MAGRPPGSDDRDQEFLDRVIALALDVIERAREIKDLSDEPEIVLLALEIESRGLLIQGITRRYRGRVKELKKMARCPPKGDTAAYGAAGQKAVKENRG